MTDWFGEDVAATYDEDEAAVSAPEVVRPAVDLLARLAGDGRALELGVGTGRLALPLAARGVPVSGVDLSTAMLDRLRAKPGSDALEVLTGDMTTTRVDGSFSVVYLVFNTINNLTTQDAQVACFRNAAAHLSPGGCFVVEVSVPPLRLLPPGQRAVPFQVGEQSWAYDLVDCATQEMSSHYVVDGRHTSTPFRYVWPSELDLMARLAGLRLRDRWEDWDGTPFGHESRRHVSVWELTG